MIRCHDTYLAVLPTSITTNRNIVNNSDDRLKSQTVDLTNALDLINQVRVREYQYHPTHRVPEGVEDSDLTGIEHSKAVGVVAQEIRTIPELAWLVHEADDTLSVDYTSLNVYLLRAVQQLTRQVTELQARV